MFTPTLCGPAYGTIQRKIVVKLRFYNDLLLFEGLFEDPREGFLKPISGERGIRTPETLLTFTRFPGVPLQPLEHLSLAVYSFWTLRGWYKFAADLHSGIGRKSNIIFSLNR